MAKEDKDYYGRPIKDDKRKPKNGKDKGRKPPADDDDDEEEEKCFDSIDGFAKWLF